MPPQSTNRESGSRPRRGLVAGAAGLATLGLAALLLASGSTSLASEPAPGADSGGGGLGSEAWIAGWIVVLLALSALYAFERRQRAKLALTRAGAGSWSPSADLGPPAPPVIASVERAVAAPPRPIEVLLKRKPGPDAGERPRPASLPTPRLILPEDSTLLRRPAGRVAQEPDAESAAPEETPPSRLERCVALRAEGRFEEAARNAREGLAGDDEPGPLLIELSRAELGRGRVAEAIDTARDAHFTCRDRESLLHLIRLLVDTRRFGPEEGATLRRAALRHPEQPLLRHAAGVFEWMLGEPARAEAELRAALALETDAERRAAIERDLASVEAAPAGGGETQRS